MSLIARLQKQPTRKASVGNGFRTEEQKKEDFYNELKSRVHYRLLDLLDLSRLAGADDAQLFQDIRRGIEIILGEDNIALSLTEKERLTKDIRDELLGYGPLEQLLGDATVSDVLVNGYDSVYVERRGKLEKTPVRFKDNAHLLKIIEKIASGVGRRVDESCPMVDARLPDGSRVNAIIAPLALDGPALSIRKFSKDPYKVHDLIEFGTITEGIAKVLEAMVKARLNILISGGTGSGKTTFLNVLSAFIPNDERIITIEDAAELQLQQDHVVRLETRPPNMEGMGEVTQRDLVRNALRMRPERIILGEVRQAEALDMLQAMNTGHDGSLATIHANTPRDALVRLETMVAMAGLNIPDKALRHQIASAIHVVIQVARLKDGSRKMLYLNEIVGMEGEVIVMQEIFRYEMLGLTEEGKVRGRFRATGIRPKFMTQLEALGVDLPSNVFREKN
ncbi:CpaF family protein [Desulfobacca acetoxidans]|uniref:Type II secretion system protein E n=1 Tax=Desulfobacca acetoxidans (strain ATCC 700848 / DSM 11109 / ASRB2) TaxID=880072 RepID=F2NJW9_DESAR|nr:CpaF family protein [Desulfobacca acetoxidans]AEB09913.1 type II secretion system protein E [Desulfobacca acetoxidans DSM 11109]